MVKVNADGSTTRKRPLAIEDAAPFLSQEIPMTAAEIDDRLRIYWEALTAIADCDVYGFYGPTGQHPAVIARKALGRRDR